MTLILKKPIKPIKEMNANQPDFGRTIANDLYSWILKREEKGAAAGEPAEETGDAIVAELNRIFGPLDNDQHKDEINAIRQMLAHVVAAASLPIRGEIRIEIEEFNASVDEGDNNDDDGDNVEQSN